jgi:hypothetical protein
LARVAVPDVEKPWLQAGPTEETSTSNSSVGSRALLGYLLPRMRRLAALNSSSESAPLLWSSARRASSTARDFARYLEGIPVRPIRRCVRSRGWRWHTAAYVGTNGRLRQSLHR